MCAEKGDRRKNRRVFFLKNDDMKARLTFLGGDETHFQVRLKDLSSAGIGFLLERTEPVVVRPGARLVLTSIQGANAVDFLTQAIIEVGWVVDTDILDHVGFGCRFIELNRATQVKLDKYILAWT